MKKALLGSVLALTVASFGASAADMISKDEAHHFKLEYLGNVSVGASGGFLHLQIFIKNSRNWQMRRAGNTMSSSPLESMALTSRP